MSLFLLREVPLYCTHLLYRSRATWLHSAAERGAFSGNGTSNCTKVRHEGREEEEEEEDGEGEEGVQGCEAVLKRSSWVRMRSNTFSAVDG